MGRNMNDTKGFVKYTVSATSIQAQFIRSFRGNFTDSFAIGDPVTAGSPAPAATPRS
jgi:hypothetical protein